MYAANTAICAVSNIAYVKLIFRELLFRLAILCWEDGRHA